MGTAKDFLQAAAGGAHGLLNTVVGNVLAGFTNRANRKFQSQENEKEREFNALQAQIARDWQEEQYNKYSSPAAMARQYEEAGFNPMLAAGMTGQTFSGATASSTSSSSPSSVFQPSDIDIVGGILDVLGFKDELKNTQSKRNVDASEIDKNEAEADFYRSLKTSKDIENEFSPQLFKQQLEKGKLDIKSTEKGLTLLDQSIEEVKSKILVNHGYFRNLISSSHLNDTLRSKALAEIDKVGSEKFLLDMQAGTELFKSILLKEQANTEQSKQRNLDSQTVSLDLDIAKKEWLQQFRNDNNVDMEYAQTQLGLMLQILSDALKPGRASNSLKPSPLKMIHPVAGFLFE